MKISNQRFLRPDLSTFVAVVLLGAIPAIRGLTINSNCPDGAPSLQMPKRLSSGCEQFSLPTFAWTDRPLPVDASGAFLAASQNTNAHFAALTKVRADGAFQWTFAMRDSTVFTSQDDAERFAVVQGRGAAGSGDVLFGIYSTGGEEPTAITERELPVGDRRNVSAAFLSGGACVVALDRTNAVALLGFGPDGQLQWAREFPGSELPSKPLLDLPRVGVHALDVPGALLQISGIDTSRDVNVSETVLVRVGDDGSTRWATRVRVELQPGGLSPGAPLLRVSPSAVLGLVVMDLTSMPSFQSTVVKLGQDGRLEWSRRMPRLMNGLHFLDDSGSILVSGLGLVSGFPESVCVVLDASGNPGKQLKLEVSGPLGSGAMVMVTGLSRTAGRVYYGAPFSDAVGSSSLLVDDFHWRKFNSPAPQPGTQPQLNALTTLNNQRLVIFSPSDQESSVDAVMLDSRLMPDADCELFSDIGFNARDLELSIEAANPEVTEVSLPGTDFGMALTPASLVFEQIFFRETGLCLPDCEFTLSATRVEFESVGGQAEIGVTTIHPEGTVNDCPWELTSPAGPANWVTFSPGSGAGDGAVNITVAQNTATNSRSATVSIAGHSVSIVQAAATPTPPPPPPAFRFLASSANGNLVELVIGSQTSPVIVPNARFGAIDFGADGKVYALSRTELHLADPGTRSSDAIGQLHFPDSTPVRGALGIACSPEGAVYVTDASGQLLEVDPATAVAHRVGDSGPKLQAIDFNPEGRLFAVEYQPFAMPSQLLEINPDTGEVLSTAGSLTVKAGLSSTPLSIEEIDFGDDGFIYGVNRADQNVYRINPATAEAEVLGLFSANPQSISSGSWIDEPLESPSLQIVRNATDVSISWRASAAGFQLQSSPSLSSGSWTPERFLPIPDQDGRFSVRVSLSSRGAREGGRGERGVTTSIFYRLVSP